MFLYLFYSTVSLHSTSFDYLVLHCFILMLNNLTFVIQETKKPVFVLSTPNKSFSHTKTA